MGFSVIRHTKGADEMLFGEIVRMLVKNGYPMVSIVSQDDYHHGKVLMQGNDLFTMDVKVKRWTHSFVMSKITDTPMRIDIQAMAILEGATFNKLLEMYKTNMSNVTKFPLLGMVKVYHDYNRIHLWATLMGRGSKYFSDTETVNRKRLSEDMEGVINELLEALSSYQSDDSTIFTDIGLNIENEVNKAEAKLLDTIKSESVMVLQCPNCSKHFEADISETVTCPHCRTSGNVDT